MKIGFIGFGKTGKEAIVPFLSDASIEICWVLKRNNEYRGKYASSLLLTHSKRKGPIFSEEDWSEDFLKKYPVDVVVDFSSSENIHKYELFAKYNIKIVSAISNYQEAEKAILNEISQKVAVLWSPNITLGINLLITVAKMIQNFTPDADIQVIESHFKEKRGVSGTALKIANALEIPRKDIHSIRVGGILGEHEIVFGYPYQTIRLSHEAISRRAFGRGALLCAQWLANKEPKLYNMEDMLKEKIKYMV
jgi:4-hydroxy-tetrahydrodipicolinate reductase